MKKAAIALVGAGRGGTAILETLLKIPTVQIRYVYDVNPQAPGLKIAREHKIACVANDAFTEIAGNPEIDLIFEVTGKKEVYAKLVSVKAPSTNVIGAAGTKIIFHLLEAEDQVNQKLKDYQLTLEQRILERTDEIDQANKKLQTQILQYEELNRELEKLNEEKTRYILQATHQLKAPFAAIQSYTDILIEGYTGEIPEASKEILKKIKVRCELLSRAIKEMLELANLKSLKTDWTAMQETALGDVLARAIENYAAVADQRRIRVDFRPVEGFDKVRGTPDQLITLFSVFLENAINYSEDGSTIDIVVARSSPERLRVDVKDRGIGIPRENLPKIFNEYFRSNNAVRKHENGTGLGLAIAKQIAQIHGFNISVDSELDIGTTVAVSAPVASSGRPAGSRTR